MLLRFFQVKFNTYLGVWMGIHVLDYFLLIGSKMTLKVQAFSGLDTNYCQLFPMYFDVLTM